LRRCGVLLLLALLVTGNAVAAATIKEKVVLDRPGPILSKDIRVAKCNAYFMTLSFHTKGISRNDELRLIGDGVQISRGEYEHPGIVAPLRVTVTRVKGRGAARSDDEVVYDREVRTQGRTSFRPVDDREVSRSAGGKALRPGYYRVDVSLLEDVGELAQVPASFSMGWSFKFKPMPDDCS
jgi:hypothetical protein